VLPRWLAGDEQRRLPRLGQSVELQNQIGGVRESVQRLLYRGIDRPVVLSELRDVLRQAGQERQGARATMCNDPTACEGQQTNAENCDGRPAQVCARRSTAEGGNASDAVSHGARDCCHGHLAPRTSERPGKALPALSLTLSRRTADLRSRRQ
jgi:hypothetical protein